MPDAGDGVGVREDAARPRAIRWGNRLPGELLRGERLSYDLIAGQRMREDAACLGRRTSKGELRDVKRPACSERQTGTCRRCGPAACQPCRGHEEPVGAQDLSARGRRTPTDWLRTRRGERSVPGVQREKRSTPTRRTGVQRAKDQRQLRPAGLDRGRIATSNPSFRSALPAEDQRQTPLQQHSLLGDSTVMPVQQGDHAPRFLWRETLEKAKQ